jgi:hypothetical protein
MYKISDNIFYKTPQNKRVRNNTFDTNEPVLDLVVIDDFYKDPMAVRNFALSQTFDISGNFPGMRTISFTNTEIHNTLQEVLNPFGEIYDIHSHSNDECIHKCTQNCRCFNGAFFMNTTQSILSWIHFDNYDYTAIVYLTPDAPSSSGTSTFKLIDGSMDPIKYEYDKTKWSQIDKIGNVFNRILIFNASMYHCPNNYFGIDHDEARLTQVIWFNLIPRKHMNDTKNIPYKEKIPKSPFILNTNYKCNILIMDNFYKHPEKVRTFALSKKFDVSGNFPGFRTQSFLVDEVKKVINYLLLPFSNYEIKDEKNYCQYNGCFQYNTSYHKSWVHTDYFNDFAGIIYLTPDAPLSSGTNFFKFSNDVKDKKITDVYSQDMTKWTEVDSIGNKFNRLILFNANRFHMSNDYFGLKLDDGRLIQIFFI